jgi:hypothetical protein
MSDLKRDVFICHASEDKNEVVRPLYDALIKAKVSCWYDEAEIQWGDSITEKVNKGLRQSRFALVVISPSSIKKNWPLRELHALLNQEASSGEVRILPLLVGDERVVQEMQDEFALINDKLFLRWNDNVDEIVQAMLARLGRGSETVQSIDQNRENRFEHEFDVPIPQIKRRFTQRDKDQFVRRSFNVVKEYFRQGLDKLEAHHEDIETDFYEVHQTKFFATVYRYGDIANRCKIWVGGHGSSDSIAYYEGRTISDIDNTLNDFLSLDESKEELVFAPSGMWFGMPKELRKDSLVAEEVAEYLWRRFMEKLG